MRQEPLSNTSISLLGSRKLSYTESPIIPQIILKEEEEEEDVKSLASTWLQQGVTYSRQSRQRRKYFPVLEGHPVGQTQAEQAVEAHGTIQSNIKRLMKEFKIYRWNPDHPNNKPYVPRVPLCLPLQPWTHGIFSSLIKYFVS